MYTETVNRAAQRDGKEIVTGPPHPRWTKFFHFKGMRLYQFIRDIASPTNRTNISLISSAL